MSTVYASTIVPPPRTEAPLLNATLGWSALAIGLERFSYYGMRALLLLYLTTGLGRTAGQAANLYSNSNALLYLTPLLGGWLADRYWGIRRARLVGGGLVLVGHLLLLGAVWLQPGLGTAPFDLLFCGGLTLLLMGNGVLAPALYVGVGRAYPAHSRRVLPAFLLMTLAVSAGAFVAPLVCGTLGDTGDVTGFKWGFLAATVGAGLLVGVVAVLNRQPAPEDAESGGAPSAAGSLPLLLVLLATAAGTAALFLALNPVWLISTGILAGLAAVLLVAASPPRPTAVPPVLVAGLAAVSAAATAFMMGIDGLQYEAQEGRLPLGVVILGPLVGFLPLWLWAGRQQASGVLLNRRLVWAGLGLLGAGLLICLAPVVLHLAGGGESGLWAARWLIAGGALFLMTLGQQCLTVVLPGLVSNPPIGRYVAFVMGMTFAVSRVGLAAADVLQLLLTKLMQ